MKLLRKYTNSGTGFQYAVVEKNGKEIHYGIKVYNEKLKNEKKKEVKDEQ